MNKVATEEQIDELDELANEIDSKIDAYNEKAKEYGYYSRLGTICGYHHDYVLELIDDGEDIDENWEPEEGWFPSRYC